MEHVTEEMRNMIWDAADASYAARLLTLRSHGGRIVYLNGGATSWKSGLQPIITLSSCEAKFVALCSIILKVHYLRMLLEELGISQKESTLVWEDNKAAIVIAEGESWSKAH